MLCRQSGGSVGKSFRVFCGKQFDKCLREANVRDRRHRAVAYAQRVGQEIAPPLPDRVAHFGKLRLELRLGDLRGVILRRDLAFDVARLHG